MSGNALLILAFLAYAAIALAAHRRWRTHDHATSARLGVVAMLLGIISLMSALPSLGVVPDGLSRATSVTTTVLLAGYPVALLHFVAALQTVPRRVNAAVLVGCGAVAVLFGARGLGLEDVLPDASSGALVSMFLVLWLVLHAATAQLLWRGGGRAGSAYARHRARAMASGVMLMGIVVLIGFVWRGGSGQSMTVAGVLGTALLWMGYAPPGALRWLWQRRDIQALASAELRVLRTPEPDAVVSHMLPAVARLLDADAVWLVEGWTVLSAFGVGAADARREMAAFHRLVPEDQVVVTARSGGEGWLLAVTSGRGWLVARTAVEPVLYGTTDIAALGDVAARLEIAVDRTEDELRRREEERGLRDAEHAAELTRLRDDVLSTMSHELRTPLVSVYGMTQLLDARWDDLDEDTRRELTTRVNVQATALTRVVEQTLELASLRTGQARFERQVIGVRELLADAVDRVAGTERVSVDVRGDPVVVVDVDRLATAVAQVVSNGLKFSPSDDTVRIVARTTDGEVVITVSDRGRGMSSEEVSQAFDVMYRSGDVLQRDTRGLGLGLTLAAATVQAMGGQIEMRSTPGEGSRVTLRLRLAELVVA